MTEINCKSVCVAALAASDGYRSALSSEEISAHLGVCAVCRREVLEIQALSGLLNAHKREPRSEDIWPSIWTALSIRRLARHRRVFVILGLLLLAYRVAEMVPDRDLGLLSNLIPVLIIVAAFRYVRENPFTINARLRLEGESSK